MKTFIEVQGPLNESSIMDITNSQIIIKIYKKLKMIYNRIIKNKEIIKFQNRDLEYPHKIKAKIV